MPFEVALDKRGRSPQAYLIRSLPTTVFVHSGGVIQRIHRGPISREQLDRGIATILPPR